MSSPCDNEYNFTPEYPRNSPPRGAAGPPPVIPFDPNNVIEDEEAAADVRQAIRAGGVGQALAAFNNYVDNRPCTAEATELDLAMESADRAIRRRSLGSRLRPDEYDQFGNQYNPMDLERERLSPGHLDTQRRAQIRAANFARRQRILARQASHRMSLDNQRQRRQGPPSLNTSMASSVTSGGCGGGGRRLSLGLPRMLPRFDELQQQPPSPPRPVYGPCVNPNPYTASYVNSNPWSPQQGAVLNNSGQYLQMPNNSYMVTPPPAAPAYNPRFAEMYQQRVQQLPTSYIPAPPPMPPSPVQQQPQQIQRPVAPVIPPPPPMPPSPVQQQQQQQQQSPVAASPPPPRAQASPPSPIQQSPQISPMCTPDRQQVREGGLYLTPNFDRYPIRGYQFLPANPGGPNSTRVFGPMQGEFGGPDAEDLSVVDYCTMNQPQGMFGLTPRNVSPGGNPTDVWNNDMNLPAPDYRGQIDGLPIRLLNLDNRIQPLNVPYNDNLAALVGQLMNTRLPLIIDAMLREGRFPFRPCNCPLNCPGVAGGTPPASPGAASRVEDLGRSNGPEVYMAVEIGGDPCSPTNSAFGTPNSTPQQNNSK